MRTGQSASVFSAPYRVQRHEYDDDKFVVVTLKCIGYPSEGTQPVEWAFSLRVPVADLGKWPIGAMVRLAVGA